LWDLSIAFLYNAAEAVSSTKYEPEERMESMENNIMTTENQTNQTIDNQTDKIVTAGVPEPI
jgi:hypothetical protein